MATAKPIPPAYWMKAKRHLTKIDPILGGIIKRYKGETLMSRGSAFYSLARAIVGQQISVKAAESVWKKLEIVLTAPLPGLPPQRGKESRELALAGGQGSESLPPLRGKVRKGGGVMPESILAINTESLRACGLSGQKVIYLRELSQFFATRSRHDWHLKSDAEVITHLVAIKGIGTWSAEMFLIFHLMRPDVFPIADLGVRKAIEKHYNKSEKMPLPAMLALSERWQPYRTVATWYLWRSLDPVPVEY